MGRVEREVARGVTRHAHASVGMAPGVAPDPRVKGKEGDMIRLTSMFAIAAALALLGSAPNASGQEYLFSVPRLQMHVVVNQDGSTRIVYDITFQNNPVGHAIDVVDVGVPHSDYDLGNVTASAAGTGQGELVALGDFRPSAYVNPGFEVHMAGQTIPPGGSGTLHVEFTMPQMVYQDTTREDYASLRITPTWFGSQYIAGNTELQVAVHLPKGVKPEDVLHQGQPFSQKVVTDEGTSVVWQWPATRLDGAHMVGLSFPKNGIQVVTVTKLDLLLKWFGESPGARMTLGIVFFVLFGFLFFRFTGGTGVTVFVILSVLFVVLFYNSPGWHLISLPIAAGLVGLNEWYLRSRKPSYMPPIAQVEGGGIKRGLAAPEAAVLLELPIPRVLGLVIFGMLKKGVLRQVQADPLVVEVDEVFRADARSGTSRTAFYREAAQKKGIVVQPYEIPFLFLLEANHGKPVGEINFAAPLKKLIERVAGRMKGFDLSDTKEYYQSICRRAVAQARAIGDIPQRQKRIDRNFEWILMDDGYPTVFTGYPYRPIWMRGGGVSGPSAPSTPSPSIPGRTSLGDVGASFAGWAENTMGGLASAITPGSLAAPKASGGFVNLSGVDRVTGEFFQALAESGGSGGGGGGGGGGCACAGCACACACAGGGR
jgi:hypothetical protein